ncbi:MAG: hypothetical protein JWR69_3170 [Pedosphaera sp.]|nr:hypothetical protein [Pedosphaera sp.]
MVAPTVLLWLYLLVDVVLSVPAIVRGTVPNASLAATFALSLILTAWVLADARKRGRALCHDYGSFVFFAWPVVLPAYLFQTRRWKALFTLLCFGGLWILHLMLASVLSTLFHPEAL